MEHVFEKAAFARWLHAVSRQGPPLGAPLRRRDALGDETSRPVVANGILAGSQAGQALQQDRAYIDAAPDRKVATLQLAPVTGCSMLLTLAREKSGYDCRTPGQPDGEAKFNNYIAQVLLCPLFRTEYDDRISNVLGGDWNGVIDSIVALYVGIPDADRTLLRDSLRAVAAAASSSPSTVERVCTFFQSTIDSSERIASFFYYMDVRMVTYVEHGGKNEPDRVHNQANLTLHRVKLLFDAAHWAAQAEAVYRETQSSLSDWLDENSTPVGPLPMNWHPR